MPAFTLVTTVLNENARLAQSLEDLAAQTVSPAELIVVDAGSADGTVATLEAWAATAAYPVRVIVQPGANIAQGRNRAIKEASHELIVSTDFGCRYHPDWLASITQPFDADPSLEVVGGAFTIDRRETQTPAARADYILAQGYPPDTSGLFSVSSRSIAYKKEVWAKIGGYQEWLTLAADDTIFWRQIKHGGYRYRLVNEAYVYWLRHTTYRSFGRESYRYGLGDGESGINRRNFFSHVAETAARYLTLTALALMALLPFTAAAGPVSVAAAKVGAGRRGFWLVKLLIFKKLGKWLLLPAAFGLRSHGRAFGYWQKLKPEGYTFLDFLRVCYLIEVTRIYYLRGYIKGWLLAPAKVKAGRATLAALPA